MSIKSILCIFEGTEKELDALETSFALAEAYSAQLRILHISPTPSNYVGIYGEGVIESSYIITAIEKENKERLERSKEFVSSCASRRNVPLDVRNSAIVDNKSNNATADFVHLTGDVSNIIAQQGRVSDIIVVGRGVSEPNAAYDSAIMAALFETARPVLLIPEGKGDKIIKWQCKNISLAWDGGLEAARALYNALPFLERADKLQLLTARGAGEASNLEAEEDVIKYLRCHNVHAVGIIVAEGNRSSAEALLTRAKELNSDILVMGAYGHSRLREMVLGGLTNDLLEKADIPLLLSH